MKKGILSAIATLLIYAFVEYYLEILNDFLVYLVPFLIATIGLLICLRNLFVGKKENFQVKKLIKIANILLLTVFTSLSLYNFPIPEDGGLRCKIWTDEGMLINPNNNNEQYVHQEIRVSGSIFDFRNIQVRPINKLVRWIIHNKEPQEGNWLYIDNSDNGENECPFTPNLTKIDFDRYRSRAQLVVIKEGLIQSNKTQVSQKDSLNSRNKIEYRKLWGDWLKYDTVYSGRLTDIKALLKDTIRLKKKHQEDVRRGCDGGCIFGSRFTPDGNLEERTDDCGQNYYMTIDSIKNKIIVLTHMFKGRKAPADTMYIIQIDYLDDNFLLVYYSDKNEKYGRTEMFKRISWSLFPK